MARACLNTWMFGVRCWMFDVFQLQSSANKYSKSILDKLRATAGLAPPPQPEPGLSQTAAARNDFQRGDLSQQSLRKRPCCELRQLALHTPVKETSSTHAHSQRLIVVANAQADGSKYAREFP